MKKRVSITLVLVLLLTCVFSIQAFAYSTPPASAGLAADSIRWTNTADLGYDMSPANFPVGTKPGTNTALVDNDAQYVQFIWWDHGEPNANTGSNFGWTWGGTTTYKINGVSVTPTSTGTDGYATGSGLEYNVIRAYLRYAVFPVSLFDQSSSNTVQIQVYRSNNHAAYVTRTVSFNFNWREALSSAVSYDSSAHVLAGLSTSMEFRYFTDTWSPWYYYTSGTNNAYNMYANLSTLRDTIIEVRYKETTTTNASTTWSYTVPELDAAPTGLYVDWGARRILCK